MRDIKLVLRPRDISWAVSLMHMYAHHEHHPTYAGRFVDKLVQLSYDTGYNRFRAAFTDPTPHLGALTGTPERPLRIVVNGVGQGFENASNCAISVYTHREFNYLLDIVPQGNSVALSDGKRTIRRVQL